MKKILIAVGILVVIVVIVAVSLGRKKVAGEGVYAEKVSRGDVVTVVTGTGVIQPKTKVNISSEVYGQIIELPVKEGQTADKGQLLVRIDPKKYRDEVNRLEANVRMSATAIESEEANLKNLEIDQRRAHKLFDQQILASSDLEKADLAVTTARIQIRSIKEQVTQAEAALSRAQQDLGKTTIYAPMAGKVTQLSSEVGEQVIIGTTNIPGSVIMVISDMSEILAEVNVDETEIVRLNPGQAAKVTADAVEKTTYEGRVTEIGNTAKRQGEVNVFGVKILLKDPDERLRPGMTAKARIEVDRRQNALRVPIQAVTARERKQLEEERKEAGKSKIASAASGGGKEEKGSSAGGAAGSGKEGAPSAGGVGESSSAGTGGPGTGAEAGAGGAGAGNEGAASGGPGTSAGGTGTPATGANSTSTTSTTKTPSASTTGADGKGGTAGKTGDEREEIEVVYVIDKDVVRAVAVKTGAGDETYVEIKEGLEEGQTVVKGPYRVLRRLKEGDRIVVKDEKDAAAEAEKASESRSGGGSRD